jgi:hypothetical protein
VCVCVCVVALVIQHAMHMRRVVCGRLPVPYSPHYLINFTTFRNKTKKIIGHKMCFDFL